MPDDIEESACIRVSGVVDVETVVEQRQELLGMIKSNAARKLDIDLAAVEISGTAVMTLLISVQREARKLQKQVSFINCPDNVLAVARACGVDGILLLSIGATKQ